MYESFGVRGNLWQRHYCYYVSVILISELKNRRHREEFRNIPKVPHSHSQDLDPKLLKTIPGLHQMLGKSELFYVLGSPLPGCSCAGTVFITWFCVRGAGRERRVVETLSGWWVRLCGLFCWFVRVLWMSGFPAALAWTCGGCFSSFLWATWHGVSSQVRPERGQCCFGTPQPLGSLCRRMDILIQTPTWTSWSYWGPWRKQKWETSRIGFQLMGWSKARKHFRGHVTLPGDLEI